MRAKVELSVVGVLVVAVAALGACKGGNDGYWCRKDDRQCFAKKSECEKRRIDREAVECFSQAQVFCFAVKGDMFDKPEGQRVCLPTEEECWDWRQDRVTQRPTLGVGMCRSPAAQ